MSKRSMYYESDSEDDGIEIPSPTGKKASSLSARFKAIAKHDREDYMPSDEDYDSQEEVESLSDAEEMINKPASPITPFNKKRAQARKIESSDSETEDDPQPKKITKPVVSAPKPKTLSTVKPVEVKAAKKVPTAEVTPPKPTKSMKPMKDFNAISTPGLKARMLAALNSDDEDELEIVPVKKSVSRTAVDEDNLIAGMEKMSLSTKPVSAASKAKEVKKPVQKVEESDSEEEEEEPVVTKTKPIKKSVDKENVSKKANKEKKEKDPNAPKKAMSAYLFFCQERRQDVRSENPDLSMVEISKLLGEEWKALDESEKKRFNKMAQKDKARYEAAKAQHDRSIKA